MNNSKSTEQENLLDPLAAMTALKSKLLLLVAELYWPENPVSVSAKKIADGFWGVSVLMQDGSSIGGSYFCKAEMTALNRERASLERKLVRKINRMRRVLKRANEVLGAPAN
jgi:hypothetical protein